MKLLIFLNPHAFPYSRNTHILNLDNKNYPLLYSPTGHSCPYTWPVYSFRRLPISFVKENRGESNPAPFGMGILSNENTFWKCKNQKPKPRAPKNILVLGVSPSVFIYCISCSLISIHWGHIDLEKEKHQETDWTLSCCEQSIVLCQTPTTFKHLGLSEICLCQLIISCIVMNQKQT